MEKKGIRKYIGLWAVVGLMTLGGCGTKTTEAEGLTVFAAASLTDAMTEIGEKFEAETGQAVVMTFDSSGTLKTQIEEGATCHIFLSAAEKPIKQLVEGGIIAQETVHPLLENEVVLIVAEEKVGQISGFEALVEPEVGLIAIGNEDVPAGSYAKEIFETLGIWEQLLPKFTYASNVREVLAQVEEGVVDCGIVYGTDAVSIGATIADKADETMLETPVTYPMAMVTETEGAKAFYEFLKGAVAKEIFTAYGFQPM